MRLVLTTLAVLVLVGCGGTKQAGTGVSGHTNAVVKPAGAADRRAIMAKLKAKLTFYTVYGFRNNFKTDTGEECTVTRVSEVSSRSAAGAEDVLSPSGRLMVTVGGALSGPAKSACRRAVRLALGW